MCYSYYLLYLICLLLEDAAVGPRRNGRSRVRTPDLVDFFPVSFISLTFHFYFTGLSTTRFHPFFKSSLYLKEGNFVAFLIDCVITIIEIFSALTSLYPLFFSSHFITHVSFPIFFTPLCLILPLRESIDCQNNK